MTKKLIFLNILIASLLILSACGTPVTVQLPDSIQVTGSGGTDPSVTVSNPAATPAQTGISNTTLIYIVVGLVVVVLLIALIAIVGASARNRSQ